MTKDEILDRLQEVVAKEPIQWIERADYRADNKKWLKRSQAVTLLVLRTLREKGITQKDLALLMEVSPQQVNKWMKGKENFTFDTIARLEEALGVEIMTIVQVGQPLAKNWVELPYLVRQQPGPVRVNRRGTVKSKSIVMGASITKEMSFSTQSIHSKVG